MANSDYNNKKFLDQNGLNWLFDFLTPDLNSDVYKPIDEALIEYDISRKITPIWNNGDIFLNNLHTESLQDTTNFKDYSLNIYSTRSCGSNVKEFTIEYGHVNGLGTTSIPEYVTQKTETKAIYKKYKFLFGDEVLNNYSHVYAIKFSKTSSQDRLYSELFELKLANPTSPSNYSDLINLEYFLSQSTFDLNPPDVSNIVSGSLETGIYYENGSPIYFGKLHSKESILLLDGNKLDTYVGFNTNSGSNVNGSNAEKLYISISQSINNDKVGLYKYWSYIHGETTRNIMTMPIDILLSEFNYTTNPTFYDSNGKIKTNQFINDPNTYFTTIGLYNTKYQLLAVAKLSRPLLKNYNEMYMFEINLELK